MSDAPPSVNSSQGASTHHGEGTSANGDRAENHEASGAGSETAHHTDRLETSAPSHAATGTHETRANSVPAAEAASPQYRLRCPAMPLAVYREVAAHLRQVIGVDVGLLPQLSQEFDYTRSQVGGLWISYQPDVGQTAHQRVEEILAYYGDRFGAWEAIYQDE